MKKQLNIFFITLFSFLSINLLKSQELEKTYFEFDQNNINFTLTALIQEKSLKTLYKIPVIINIKNNSDKEIEINTENLFNKFKSLINKIIFYIFKIETNILIKPNDNITTIGFISQKNLDLLRTNKIKPELIYS